VVNVCRALISLTLIFLLPLCHAWQESEESAFITNFKGMLSNCQNLEEELTFLRLGLAPMSDGDSEWFGLVLSEYADKCTKSFVLKLSSFNFDKQDKITWGFESLAMTDAIRQKLKAEILTKGLKGRLSSTLVWLFKE
jgi:hypothetical protein